MGDPIKLKLNVFNALLKQNGGKIAIVAGLPPLIYDEDFIEPVHLEASSPLYTAGQLPDLLRRAVTVAAAADRSNQVIAPISDDRSATCAIYYTPDKRSPGIRVDDNGQVEVINIRQMIDGLISILAPAQQPVTTIESTHQLSVDDAFILAVVFDLHRMAYNRSNASTAEPVLDCSIKSIMGGLDALDRLFMRSPTQKDLFSKMAPSPAKRTAILLSALVVHTPQDQAAIEAGIARLVSSGLAVATKTGWTLSPSLAIYARDLCQVTRAVFLEKYFAHGDLIETEETLLLAGETRHLAFTTDSRAENQVELRSYSQMAGKTFLDDFFNHPLESVPEESADAFQTGEESGSQDGASEVKDESQEIAAPAGSKKMDRKVLIALILAAISLCVSLGGCALAALASTW